MKKLVFGFLAIIIGLPGFSLLFSNFIGVVTGGLPIVLILGGGLAFYLGFEEIRAEKKDTESPVTEDLQKNKETSPLEQDLASTAPRADAPNDETMPKSDPDSADDINETTKPASNTQNEKSLPQENLPSFMGNIDTLVFHSLECNFSQGKKCTAAFATREDALSQGYKPCKVCNP
ncbi:MAG: hypothetical protein HUK40_23600 [Desulfobacter sp.]|nr:hypothetical protein [Desulfobacter sp.]WDP86743.1 MAG: hypothetical protein HUN05_17795 [Desulfobacter sp.]